ncbi:MAG: DUF2071 domain-containing protein [Planctomycetes bacterium]|nr:DUF2071 domain-containing protein [Planctomycetota bacterium]
MRMPDASHRSWPPPSRPWILAQSWADVLFLHWRMPIDALASRLPGGVALDTHDGDAWISVVPFRMLDVHLRGLPPMPGMAHFPELNVRTYVTVGERRGVWFFSLDAASRLTVSVARRWFHLPYFQAEMRVEHDRTPRGTAVRYVSRRTDARGAAAEFDAAYVPIGSPRVADRGSLDHFLAERYCLFAARPDGTILRGDVHHAAWPLQPVDLELTRCTMLEALGLPTPDDPPYAAWAARVDVPTWSPKVVWRGTSRPR